MSQITARVRFQRLNANFLSTVETLKLRYLRALAASPAMLAALLAAAVALAAPAQAGGGLIQTFVSGAGDDSNPCTVTAPCQTFAVAYTNTASGGVISALDRADYGPLTINGPITIDGNGLAAITTPSGGLGVGITIRSGPSDKIVLLGLKLDGAAAGGAGIEFISGGSLIVEDCFISGMLDAALIFISQLMSTPEKLVISNSHFNNNGGYGVEIGTGEGSSSTIVASIDRAEFLNNGGDGLFVSNIYGTAPVIVQVTDSIAAYNGISGFHVGGGPGSSSESLSLTRSLAFGNTNGVQADVSGTIWLSQSTLTRNTTGYNDGFGGVINSYGDNDIRDTNNTGTLTPVGKQ
jgi:hypothetical protein